LNQRKGRHSNAPAFCDQRSNYGETSRELTSPAKGPFSYLPIYPLCYNAAMKQFKQVTETVVDSRKRISLGKAGVAEDTRYAVSVSDDGDILLTPLATIPAREMLIWERPDVMASLQRGIADAEAGRVVRRNFIQYLDDDDE